MRLVTNVHAKKKNKSEEGKDREITSFRISVAIIRINEKGIKGKRNHKPRRPYRLGKRRKVRRKTPFRK